MNSKNISLSEKFHRFGVVGFHGNLVNVLIHTGLSFYFYLFIYFNCAKLLILSEDATLKRHGILTALFSRIWNLFDAIKNFRK